METVYLSSSQSLNEFPENHGGDFRNILNHGFRFAPRHHVKVGLGEMLYIPGSWDNIRGSENYYDIELVDYPIGLKTKI